MSKVIPGMQEFCKQLAAKLDARKKALAEMKNQTSETYRDDKPNKG